MWTSNTANKVLMPILWATKRNTEAERERKKNKDEIRICVENHRPILLNETTFCVTSLLLPPDCHNRRNISKPFNLRKELENRWWCQPRELSSFFICFLFTFCVCVYQRERWETPNAQLLGRGRAQRRMSAAGLLSPDPLPVLIRTYPCWLPPLSKSRRVRHRELEGKK